VADRKGAKLLKHRELGRLDPEFTILQVAEQRCISTFTRLPVTAPLNTSSETASATDLTARRARL